MPRILRPADPNKRPQQVKITIPLSAVPKPSDPQTKQAVGLDIAFGWHDPAGDEASKLLKVKIEVRRPLFFSQGGGGITAYVRSDDGRWTYYYAHLSAYAPGLHEGQHVLRGAPVGFVGATGNANPDGPHLHFAINRMEAGEKWWQGTAINPYPLLAAKPARR